MSGYVLLNDLIFRHKGYSVSSITTEDAESVRNWRNEQVDALRQDGLLSRNEQATYFREHVIPEYQSKTPEKILLRFCLDRELIGYGGLVHLSWPNRRGEVSFLLSSKRSRDLGLYNSEFKVFLKLIMEIGFLHLNLNKLSTEAYAHRPHHVKTIESSGFKREGILRKQTLIEGRWVDAIVCSCLREEYSGLHE